MLEKITEAEINERSMARVSTTPGRKTGFGENNLGPEALKLRFDRLGRFLAGKINEILGSIEDGSIAEYIYVDHNGNKISVEQFITNLMNGDVDNIQIKTAYGIVYLTEIAKKTEEMYNGQFTGDGAKNLVVVPGVTLKGFYEEFKVFEGETAPVQSVNGKKGDVELNAEDVGARPDTWMPSAKDVNAEPVGAASSAVEAHNNNGKSHQDIRRELKDLTNQMANAGAVKSVNNKTGAVSLDASDVGARPSTWTPTAEEVGARASDWLPTPAEIGAVTSSELKAQGDALSALDQITWKSIDDHKVDAAAHNDIRLLIQELGERLNAALDSTDLDLDQLSEIVQYIKTNSDDISKITTNKINYTDIINDLTTTKTDKPLSAAQGVALKRLIDNLTNNKLDASALTSAINTALAQAKASGAFDGEDGKTPYVGNDGYWYINGASTGVKAQGDNGVGISKVEKTATNGKVDTYTITFTNGTTFVYTVTNGKDYVLTDEDRAEIADEAANRIDTTKFVQSVNNKKPDANGNVTVSVNAEPPQIVDGVEEMLDHDKQYVNKQTGTIWVWKTETYVDPEGGKIKKENMPFEGTYRDEARLSSSTAGDTFTEGASQAGYHLTPMIDLAAIKNLIKDEIVGNTYNIHLDGAHYSFKYNGTWEQWMQTRGYGTDKTVLFARIYTTGEANGNALGGNVNNITITVNSDQSTTISIVGNPTYSSAQTPIGYFRFTGKHSGNGLNNAYTDSNIYVTYPVMKTAERWVDTGVSYGGGGGVDAETLAKIAALNNEGETVSSISLLPRPVYNYLNSPSYTDGDYSYTQVEKVTYHSRADIPVPYTIKWNYNEDAMRTTVAVDTKAIGTSNAHSMLVYDVTGLNKFPVYNLLPNRTYYYKVSHVMSNGVIQEAKGGSFSTESYGGLRLIYIDGTQNVRDLGGRTAKDGKKVKYGLLYRGGALSDSSYPELIVTGKGRRAFGDLKVQAELNLGATDTETSIASNCDYKKIGYSNYALAITTASQRENFKIALEWIVARLTEGKPVYFHCQGGCDRTGTMAFLLLGLLGVSEDNLSRDYELSSFSSIGYGRWRNSTSYNYSGMVSAIKDYGGNINNAFYAFATNSTDAAQSGCGIDPSVVDSFRSLMLE